MWAPDKLRSKKAVSAACADLTCRFAKEAAQNKTEMLADVDFLDVTVRQETMNNVQGQPVQVQLGVVPCYACLSDCYCYVVHLQWLPTDAPRTHTHTHIILPFR